ncbi:hypothetical protein [Microbacterium karelineae]|uniref:hypothetical protein n=1 Tax=Microbacterium karelineae TaxID=2654283 RepID=UPI0012E9FD8C|nr:hypothetical protein [Microbacterium karelineae]
MAETLEQRCERLREPILQLAALSLGSAVSPKDIDETLAAARRVQQILDDDTSGIAPGGYLDWVPTGRRVISDMVAALERGDRAESYRLFTDKTDGFYRLGLGCAGFPGW